MTLLSEIQDPASRAKPAASAYESLLGLLRQLLASQLDYLTATPFQHADSIGTPPFQPGSGKEDLRRWMSDGPDPENGLNTNQKSVLGALRSKYPEWLRVDRISAAGLSASKTTAALEGLMERGLVNRLDDRSGDGAAPARWMASDPEATPEGFLTRLNKLLRSLSGKALDGDALTALQQLLRSSVQWLQLEELYTAKGVSKALVTDATIRKMVEDDFALAFCKQHQGLFGDAEQVKKCASEFTVWTTYFQRVRAMADDALTGIEAGLRAAEQYYASIDQPFHADDFLNAMHDRNSEVRSREKHGTNVTLEQLVKQENARLRAEYKLVTPEVKLALTDAISGHGAALCFLLPQIACSLLAPFARSALGEEPCNSVRLRWSQHQNALASGALEQQPLEQPLDDNRKRQESCTSLWRRQQRTSRVRELGRLFDAYWHTSLQLVASASIESAKPLLLQIGTQVKAIVQTAAAQLRGPLRDNNLALKSWLDAAELLEQLLLRLAGTSLAQGRDLSNLDEWKAWRTQAGNEMREAASKFSARFCPATIRANLSIEMKAEIDLKQLQGRVDWCRCAVRGALARFVDLLLDATAPDYPKPEPLTKTIPCAPGTTKTSCGPLLVSPRQARMRVIANASKTLACILADALVRHPVCATKRTASEDAVCRLCPDQIFSSTLAAPPEGCGPRAGGRQSPYRFSRLPLVARALFQGVIGRRRPQLGRAGLGFPSAQNRTSRYRAHPAGRRTRFLPARSIRLTRSPLPSRQRYSLENF